jgi:hypothetical protein
MIRFTPRTIFSWDFRLESEDHDASIEVNWLSEQGLILADGASFQVEKHGVFSGQWTMKSEGTEFAVAQKMTTLRRTFEISSPMGDLSLIPESLFSRRFRVECAGKIIARIRPEHLFTRRSRIEFLASDFDFPTICFTFWLVLITWRRSNESS